MSHLQVKYAGLTAVFPLEGDPVVLQFGTKILSPEGAVLLEEGDFLEFCAGIGIRPKYGPPTVTQRAFLNAFRDAHFPSKRPNSKKTKRKATTKSKAKLKPELTLEQKQEKHILGLLAEEFSCRDLGHQSDETGHRSKGRGRGRGRRSKTVLYGITDKHGKLAEATYAGNGMFVYFSPREGGGTKTLARNRWAARQITERYVEILASLKVVEETVEAPAEDSEAVAETAQVPIEE